MKHAQLEVDQWIKTFGVRYFDEMTNMVLLMEEVGELSRYMARTYGEQSFKSSENASQAKEKIREELADVLFVLLCLSNQMGIDLDKALAESLEKKAKRDRERHSSNSKLK